MNGWTPGIDVSHWQGKVDWPAVAASGYRFAYIKLTQGRGFRDPRGLDNVRRAREAGLEVGGYHFVEPQHAVDEQLSHIRAVFADAGCTLPPALDCEKYTDLTGKDTANRAAALATAVGAALRPPVIYVGRNYWRYELARTTALAHLPLWVVNYSATAKAPKFPEAWQDWTLWQHSHTGKVKGIAGDVDLNWLQGGELELHALATGKPTATPPEPAWPTLNLNAPLPPRGPAVARLQGLLLAWGHGPAGLVDPKTGRPDGIGGKATRSAYAAWAAANGRPAELVDAGAWRALVAGAAQRVA